MSSYQIEINDARKLLAILLERETARGKCGGNRLSDIDLLRLEEIE